MLLLDCGSADALEFGSGLETSVWSAAGNNQECVLEHEVPGYGLGRFRHRAGATREFELATEDPRFDSGTLSVAAEPPPWRPHLASTRLADLKHEGGVVGVNGDLSSRMLGSLTRGYEVVVSGPMQFSNTARVRVLLSATRFEAAYQEFVACENKLLPASFAQIERSRIAYGSGGHGVPAAATRVLEEVAGYVTADPTVTRIYVDGHTDDKGLARDNVAMSRRRAEAVAAYLVDAGVPAGIIVTRYHGDKYPAVSNTSAGNRARNRRTTIRLTREPAVEPATNAEMVAKETAIPAPAELADIATGADGPGEIPEGPDARDLLSPGVVPAIPASP